jgi:hypothetical protein
VPNKSDSPAAALARMRAESLSPERRREIATIASAAAVEARKIAKKAAERLGKKRDQTGAAPDAESPSDTQSSAHQSEGEAQNAAAGRSPIPNEDGGVGPGAAARPAILSEVGGAVPDGIATARDLYTDSRRLRQEQAQAPAFDRSSWRPVGPGDCMIHASTQRCQKCGATVTPVHIMMRLIAGSFCERCCPACHPAG